MNKPVNTTVADKVATPMNRRWFLAGAPVAAAASITALLAAGHGVELLSDRIQRLAGELSELLNQHENGELSLSVSPSNHRERPPFRFFNIKHSKQLKEEIIRDVKDVIGPSDPVERLKFLAKEIKETAAYVHPEVTDWQMWEGRGESGNNAVFFTLTGKVGG